MKPVSELRTETVKKLQRTDFETQTLYQCFYLLKKSLDRHEQLKKSGAEDIVIDTQQVLIARQLFFLQNSEVMSELYHEQNYWNHKKT